MTTLWSKLWFYQQFARIRQWLSRRWVQGALSIVLVGIIFIGLGGMVYQNWDIVISYQWEIRPLPLIASFFLYTFALALAVLIWGHIMSAFAVTPMWAKHFRIYITTNVAQRLPGVFWHVVGRAILYEREGVPKRAVVITSGMEFALTAVSGLLLSFLTAPTLILNRFNSPWWIVAIVVIPMLLLHPRFLLVIIKRLHLLNSEELPSLKYKTLLAWIAIYGLIWLIGGVILYAIINIVYPISVTNLSMIIGVWSISGTLAMLSTFSPSGLGIREISLTILISPIIPSGIAVLIALIVRLLITLFEIFWAIISIKLLKQQ